MSEFRKENINEIVEQLKLERDKRNFLHTRFRNSMSAINVIHDVLAVTTVGLNVIGLGLLSTIVATPAVIAIEAVAAGTGIIFIASKQVNKRFTLKAEKHEAIKLLTERTIDKITKYISEAIDDEIISDEEFTLIQTEVENFRQQKEQLNKKFKTSSEDSLFKGTLLRGMKINSKQSA